MWVDNEGEERKGYGCVIMKEGRWGGRGAKVVGNVGITDLEELA